VGLQTVSVQFTALVGEREKNEGGGEGEESGPEGRGELALRPDGETFRYGRLNDGGGGRGLAMVCLLLEEKMPGIISISKGTTKNRGAEHYEVFEFERLARDKLKREKRL